LFKSGSFHRVFFALVFLGSFLGVFWDSFPGNCLASDQDGFKLSRRDRAFGVYFSDDKNGWIVGDSGLVLKTDNHGKSWEKITFSEGSTFNDVCFVGEKGWIVGARGTIFGTGDNGKTWQKQESKVHQSLMKVFFLDKNKGFTVGVDGTILKTVNGGSSWENVSIDCMTLLPVEMMEVGIISLNLYDILFLDENSGWIVGDSGTVLHSEDGGNEWKLTNIGPVPPLFSISFMNADKGWAVGQNGYSLKTEDGGKTWEKVVIEEGNSLYKVRIFNDYGVIVGDHATIIETNDGGKTWVKVANNLNPPYPWLTDAWILPDNSAKVLSIGRGIILETKIVSKN